MKKILILLIMCILLSGCFFGIKVKKYKNYTNSEIINLANNFINEELNTYSGNYNLKIIETKPLEVCTFSINVCHTYQTVKGANEYILEAVNTKTGIAEFQISVKDKYYKNNELITPRVFSENAYYNVEFYERYSKFVELLKKYSSIKYHLINNYKSSDSLIIQFGYIYSSDINELENFLNTISKRQYNYYWDFIITNDLNEYNFLVNSNYSFSQLIGNYDESTVTYKVDLSSFENNPHGIIENTSQGSSTCVNKVLIKRQ